MGPAFHPSHSPVRGSHSPRWRMIPPETPPLGREVRWRKRKGERTPMWNQTYPCILPEGCPRRLPPSTKGIPCFVSGRVGRTRMCLLTIEAPARRGCGQNKPDNVDPCCTAPVRFILSTASPVTCELLPSGLQFVAGPRYVKGKSRVRRHGCVYEKATSDSHDRSSLCASC
ncbi:uncharacterized protein B0I36DRAFT_132562 [Microdochium trichocladiopsis]|uniref:Uncharacterized protein n=1 Tax=Microdochium trichocladiopsis TaxID=1682393 RepID=A0A9P8Y6T1_9PEZI|nr:uncharacterized protein B0I36DRAFT_132562 [Microdochium trichocladiopsis]KAH7029428.1 hypothetical protein B0I36DRAFT_132562 [Microdochium trichocladiopsis]